MQSITLPASDRSPQVEFDFAAGHFAMAGESYPEDAANFFGPLLQALKDHLATPSDTPVVMDLSLIYFNSSSAKALMNMFQVLESAAEAGRAVTIRWHYQSDDETMQEFGEDFAEDFEHATFTLCPV